MGAGVEKGTGFPAVPGNEMRGMGGGVKRDLFVCIWCVVKKRNTMYAFLQWLARGVVVLVSSTSKGGLVLGSRW